MPIINPEKEFREGVSHNNARLHHSPGRGRLPPGQEQQQGQKTGTNNDIVEAEVVSAGAQKGNIDKEYRPVPTDQPVGQLNPNELDNVFDYRDLFIEDVRTLQRPTDIHTNDITRFSDGPPPPQDPPPRSKSQTSQKRQFQPHLSSSMTHIRIVELDMINVEDPEGDDGDTETSVDVEGGDGEVNNANSNGGKAGSVKRDEPDGSCGFRNCPRYKVSPKLKSEWKVQAHFFSKIMLVKTVQLVLINIWLWMVGYFPDLNQCVVKHSDMMYIALGFFFGIFIALRVVARKKSNWHPAITILTLLALTVCIAYALGAATQARKVFAIPTFTWILMITFFLLSIAPFLIKAPITNVAITRNGGIIALIISIILLLIDVYSEQDIDVQSFATYIWIPAILVSEAVLWMTIWEIQRIVWGWCFDISERRWLFASLYV